MSGRIHAWATLAVLASLATPATATVWPSSHQRVAEALDSADLTERRRAASMLSTLPPAMARGLAVKALRDGDADVRIHGARAAARLGVDNAGDEVVAWLQERDARLRLAACELIEASPTPGSVQALARILSDAKPEVREAAAAAMGASGLPETVGPLLGHLDDNAAEVRLEVVRALGRLGDDRAVVPLVSKLQDQEEAVRREAARALGRLGDERAASTLMLALQDKSLAVRVQALDSLGELRAESAVAAIAAVLTSDAATGADGPARTAALRALGRIASPQAIRLLIDALASEGAALDADATPVRKALALAGAPAVAALEAALAGSPTRRLASALALALADLSATSARPAIERASRRGQVDLVSGLTALGRLGDPAALPFVLEHLDEPDPSVRRTVVEVASRLLEPGTQDGRAVDVVKARVLDPTTSLGERIALCHLLGRTGSDRAQAVLLSLVGARPDALRIAALDALGELGRPGEAVDRALLGAFDDPSSRVRMAAATALGRVGQDAAAEQLLHRLDASAAQDRPALGVALSAALGRSQRPDLAQKVEAALPTVSGPSRDALLEGLGRMATPEALAALERASKSADPDDRRKVAEALAGVAGSESLLLQLSEDPDPTVRANASWALGAVGSKAAVPRLAALVEDLDVAVAGNAATGLGRAVGREAKDDPKAKATLCKALDDFRAYVRVGALNGLRFGGFSLGGEGDCAAPEVLRLLRRDGAFRVRLAAAQLLRTAPTAPGAKPGFDRALWRCASEDRDASVARLCQAPPPPPPKERDEVTVYVVPDGKTDPRARAPFALVLADGALRLGVADRRGALYEDAAPRGEIRLAVPAALVR